MLNLSHGRRLELLTPPLGRRHAVLDRLADRVVRIRDDVARALRRLFRTLNRLARAQFDRLAPQVVDLSAART